MAIFGSLLGFNICLPTHGVDTAVFDVQLPSTMVPAGIVVLPWLYGPILPKGSFFPVASNASGIALKSRAGAQTGCCL